MNRRTQLLTEFGTPSRMDDVTVGITRSSSTFAWPVRWDTMAARAAATDHEPDEFAHCSLLAAHRVLDRLAAMAFDAVHGVFGRQTRSKMPLPNYFARSRTWRPAFPGKA